MKKSANPPAQPNQAAQPYFMQDADLMTAEMTAAAKDGVACIVDGGLPDMGRDLDFLKQVSTKSGLPNRGRLRLLRAALLSS